MPESNLPSLGLSPGGERLRDFWLFREIDFRRFLREALAIPRLQQVGLVGIVATGGKVTRFLPSYGFAAFLLVGESVPPSPTQISAFLRAANISPS